MPARTRERRDAEERSGASASDHPFFTRKSVPVISCGSLRTNIARIVGGMSRRRPFGLGLRGDAVGVLENEEEGDGIGLMCRVGTASDGIDHHLGVAMICGDQDCSPLGANSFLNLFEAGVDGLNSLDGGLDLARMADHV